MYSNPEWFMGDVVYHCHELVAVKAMSGQACNCDTEPDACNHSTWETEARRTVSVFQSDLGHVLNGRLGIAAQ